MTVPENNLKKRTIVIIAIAIIAATALTIEGTYYVITHLTAFYNPNDPLSKSGGLSPEQQRALKRN
jgi:hypothetical protein